MKLNQLIALGIIFFLASCADQVELKRLSSGATTTCSSTVSGVLDTTFGTAGARQIDDPASVNAGDEAEIVNDIILNSSGDIYTTGRIDNESIGEQWMVSITKHNGITGALDTSFGGGDGIVNFDGEANGIEEGRDIEILSNGDIVITGAIESGGGPSYLLISKWNSIGNSETRVTFDTGTGGVGLAGCATVPSNDTQGRAIVLDSSDNFYITGYCRDQAGGQRGLIVLKTNSNGVADTTFDSSGTNGFYIFGGEDATDEDGKDILRDSSGNLIILGQRGLNADTNSDTLLIKLNSIDGELDTSFGGGDGIVDDATKGQINKGIIDSSGRIYAVGRSHNGVNWDMTIWRYTSSGLLDTTWGTSGETDFNLGADETARNVEIDSCGNLVVFGFIEDSGSSRENTAIWRYTSSGSLDTSFGSGNGYVTNTLEGGSNDRAFTGTINSSTNRYITGGTIRTDAADSSCSLANKCDLYLTKWE